MASELNVGKVVVSQSGNGEVSVSRDSGATILTQAQSALGKFGTTSNHSLQLMANNTGYLTIDSGGAVSVPDNGELQCGDSSDLRLYHNASDSFIRNQTGRLLLGCDGNILFTNAATSTAKLTIDSAGTVTMPSTPAFSAAPSAAQNNLAVAPAVVDIVLGTEIFDQGANFASNTFTAPVAGRYQLNAILGLVYIDSAADFYQVQIATSNRTYTYTFDPDFGQDAVYWEFGPSVLADMDASDTAVMRFYQSGGTAQTDVATVRTYFNGYLAC